MTSLELRAELMKLERALARDDGELAWLADAPLEDVRTLRRSVEGSLRSEGGEAYGRLLAASRLLPDKLVASIAQRVFPPVICAQMAGEVEPDRAASLVKHFTPPFLAELSAHIAPETVEHLVPALPHDVLVAVAGEIARRQDHLTGGRLTGLAPTRSLPDLVAAVEDEHDLLQIAFLLEAPERLDDIVDAIPDDRLDRVLAAAAAHERWAEAMWLTTHISDDRLDRLAHRTACASPEVVASLVSAATREQLWEQLLPLVGHLSDQDVPRVAGVDALREPATLDAVLAAAQGTGSLGTVVRVVLAMEEPQQRVVGEALPELDEVRVAELLDAARAEGVDVDGVMARLAGGT